MLLAALLLKLHPHRPTYMGMVSTCNKSPLHAICMLLAALLLDASSSSPYIHEIGHHLQQVTLARYLHAAGCTTAGRFILIALHT